MTGWKRLGDTDAMAKVKTLIADHDARMKAKYPDGIPDEYPPEDTVMVNDRRVRLFGACPTCYGAGWQTVKGRPSELIECPDCDAAARRNEARIESLAEGSGMTLHRGLTFEESPPRSHQTELWQAGLAWTFGALQHAGTLNYKPCLWLTGESQTGKTRLAYCIANVFLSQGKGVIFRDVPTLMDELRDSYSDKSDVSFAQVKATLTTTGLLVLDDLGRQTMTEWVQEKLYQLFKARIEDSSRPTLVTTNWTFEELDMHMSRLKYRVMDEHLTEIAIFSPPKQGDLPEAAS